MPLRPTALLPTDADRRHAVGEWGTAPLSECFARTCAARGDALALIDGEIRLSFA